MSLKSRYLNLVQDKAEGAPAAAFSFFLLWASFVYGFLVRMNIFFYQAKIFRRFRAKCRVISVGNLTWGGTGKTPLVESAAKFLQCQGKRVAILTRGYGQDEVEMLKTELKDVPVLAGRNRIKSAKIACGRYRADTLILDDGFQHWKLSRDLDIVLIDTTVPFGNGRLIPRGILREPLAALSRADIFVLTKTNLAGTDKEALKVKLRRYNHRALIFEAVHLPVCFRDITSGEKVELTALRNEGCALISGIADPESLAKTLEQLGAKILIRFDFPDHYRYNRQDLARIEQRCQREQLTTLVTTEKDVPRLLPLLVTKGLSLRLLALRVEVKIMGDADKFFALLSGDELKDGRYSILVLSDGKAGHLNQAIAVAKLIQDRKRDRGLPQHQINTKIAQVKFKNRALRTLLELCTIFSLPLGGKCLRLCLSRDSWEQLWPQAANIVVSCGSALSAVNLLLADRSKGRSVILMKPSLLSLGRFDLAIIPEHDRTRPRDNVLRTKIAPNLVDAEYLKEQSARLRCRYQIPDTADQPAGPTLGVLIGGDTKNYQMDAALLNKIILQLKRAIEQLNGQLLMTTSRRTPQEIERLVKEELGNFAQCRLLIVANEKNIPEAVGGILGLSDIILVSGESISMLSEAVSAQKHTLVFNPKKKVNTKTKQEWFLERLAQDDILKIVRPEELFGEVKRLWLEKPQRQRLAERDLIYQALGKIV